MDSFLEWLKNELETRGWSQYKFAKMAGLSQSHINRLCSGKTKFGEASIRKIAMALGEDIETLRYYAGLRDTIIKNDPKRRLWQAIQTLNGEQIYALEVLIKQIQHED